MGIPAAAAVDLDVLLSDDLSKLLTAAFVPPITAAGWTQTRARIKAAFEKQLKPGEGPKELARLVKTHGVEGLDGGDRDAVEQFVKDLSGYGLFLVPAGEVESWLPELQIQGHGSRWLVPVFERMGGDPQDPRYIHPGDGDVWATQILDVKLGDHSRYASALARNDPTLLAKSDPAPPARGNRICRSTRKIMPCANVTGSANVTECTFHHSMFCSRSSFRTRRWRRVLAQMMETQTARLRRG